MASDLKKNRCGRPANVSPSVSRQKMISVHESTHIEFLAFIECLKVSRQRSFVSFDDGVSCLLRE
jgi:hypothetical protein